MVSASRRNSASKWAVERKDDVPAVRRAPTRSDTGPPSARCSGSTTRAPRGPSVLRCVNHGSGPMIYHHSLRSLRSSVERQQILAEARPFRIAVLAFDLVIRFPAARSAQGTIPTSLPWRRALRRSAPIPTRVSPTRAPPIGTSRPRRSEALPDVVAAPVNQVGCRNRVTRPAEPFTWSLRAAANSSRVIPGCSAFGSRSVAIMVHV